MESRIAIVLAVLLFSGSALYVIDIMLLGSDISRLALTLVR